jgi:hypothetical protein
MKSLLVQLDELTFRSLNRIAPFAKRQRAEFVRSAIRKAIRETEEERTRRVNLEHPLAGRRRVTPTPNPSERTRAPANPASTASIPPTPNPDIMPLRIVHRPSR